MRKFTGIFLFSLMTVCCSAQSDPSQLIGKSYQAIRLIYPRDCKDLKSDGLYKTCKIKHHAKYLFPGSRIAAETIVFYQNSAIHVMFLIGHGVIRNHDADSNTVDALIALYGQPDASQEMPSAEGFRSNTYGGENTSTTLDNYGKTRKLIDRWTKEDYQVSWGTSTYESWRDMVEEDSNPMYGLLGTNLARTTEEVLFSSRVILSGAEARAIQSGTASITSIISSPSGALVLVDGKSAGQTPAKFVLYKKSSARRVDILLTGYEPVHLKLTPNGSPIREDVPLKDMIP